MPRVLFHSISELVAVCANKESFLSGKAQGDPLIIKNGAFIVDTALGEFVAVGSTAELEAVPHDAKHSLANKSVVPGLCDGHTHPVWAGTRVHEFAWLAEGVSYLEIYNRGGGIGRTVEATRNASEDELLDLFTQRLKRMSKFGTTLVECKSGYGLDVANEMKMLKVITRGMNEHKHNIDVVSTFCGAHAVPRGKTEAEAAHCVVHEMIPELQRLIQSKEVCCEQIDIFHEKGVFVGETEEILKAGQNIGLAINFHGDELSDQNSGVLASRLNARAVSHLEKLSDEGMAQMAAKQILAVMLPTTAYILRLPPPDCRKMIDTYKVPIALGSDYNPNAHCLSMPQAMNISCCLYRMSPREAIVGATLNAAASMGREKTHGSIEVGKRADFVVVGSPAWESLIYEMVDPPIDAVFKNGTQVAFV